MIGVFELVSRVAREIRGTIRGSARLKPLQNGTHRSEPSEWQMRLKFYWSGGQTGKKIDRPADKLSVSLGGRALESLEFQSPFNVPRPNSNDNLALVDLLKIFCLFLSVSFWRFTTKRFVLFFFFSSKIGVAIKIPIRAVALDRTADDPAVPVKRGVFSFSAARNLLFYAFNKFFIGKISVFLNSKKSEI